MFKRFLSLLITIVLIVMAVPATLVYADGDEDIPVITVNNHGHIEFQGETGVKQEKYILKLDKPAWVWMNAGTREHYLTIKPKYTSPETYFYLGTPDEVKKFMGAGEYYITVSADNSSGLLTEHYISIEAYFLDAYLIKNGEEKLLSAFWSDETIDVFIDKDSSASIEFRPTSDIKYDCKWKIIYSKDSAEDYRYTVNSYSGENYRAVFQMKISNTDTIYREIPFKFRVDPHLECEQYVNVLADPHTDVTYTPSPTAAADFRAETVVYLNGETSNTLKIEDITTPYFQAFFSEVFLGDETRSYEYQQGYLFAFIFYQENVRQIELDKDISVAVSQTYLFDKTGDPATEVDKCQKIFSYTPERSGTYTFSSKSLADTYSALFDSDRNCLASNDDVICNYDWNYANTIFMRNKFLRGTEDYDSSITYDLTAGKTYYFVTFLNPTNRSKEQSYDITVRLTCDKAVDTPTPTEKPTSTTTDAPTSTTTTAPTTVPASEGGSFEDFVERLYVVALGRASEPEGKAFWCEHVGNGDLNGAQCANEFLLSKEFNDRGLSDEEFLKVLYKTFFDRDAKDDPNGFNFWMNSLKTEGRDKVVDGFINSEEWCNICASYGVKSGATRAKATIASKNAIAFAERLYTKCLGRDAEAEGLKFWSLGLTNLELTGSQAAHEFFFSKEFNDHNYDNKELLTRMYRTFMGREPEEEGMNFWLDSMKNGMTKEQVFNEFVKSPEFTQICKDYAIDRG